MTQRLTLVFLVLLRLAIGWHFLFEGVEKARSVWIGETATSKAWTSEPYFREGTGPMAKLVRSRIGDTDDMLLARLTVRPGSDDPPRQRLPELLDREWDEYLSQFARHYGLDATQLDQAKQILDAQKDYTVLWLTVKPGSVHWYTSGLWTDFDRVPFKRSYPGGSYDVNISIEDRVEEYRQKVEDLRSLQGPNSSIGRDVEKAKRATVRGEVIALRGELQSLLDKRTDGMKKALATVAPKEELKAKGPVPTPPKQHWLIRWLDYATIAILLIVGIGLMLGLFSRLSALAGAFFLLMTILTFPAFPWLPEPPNVEGHYVFVSKNVIEMIALLLLACIPSGRWFGIDGLIHAIFGKKTEAA